MHICHATFRDSLDRKYSHFCKVLLLLVWIFKPRNWAGMGCFCAAQEEFYCEVLLLDETKLTLTTQQQGIKVRIYRHPSSGTCQFSRRVFSWRALSGFPILHCWIKAHPFWFSLLFTVTPSRKPENINVSWTILRNNVYGVTLSLIKALNKCPNLMLQNNI